MLFSLTESHDYRLQEECNDETAYSFGDSTFERPLYPPVDFFASPLVENSLSRGTTLNHRSFTLVDHADPIDFFSFSSYSTDSFSEVDRFDESHLTRPSFRQGDLFPCSAPNQMNLTSSLCSSTFETEELFSEIKSFSEPDLSDEKKSSKTRSHSYRFGTSKVKKKKETKKMQKKNSVAKTSSLKIKSPFSEVITLPAAQINGQNQSYFQCNRRKWKQFLDLFLDLTVSLGWGCRGIYSFKLNLQILDSSKSDCIEFNTLKIISNS